MGRLLVIAFLTQTLFAASTKPPLGFEDSTVFNKVIAGDIVKVVEKDTASEYILKIRAYFNKKGSKLDSSDLIKLVTNHKKYEELFPEEIKRASTISVSADKKSFKYLLIFNSTGLSVRVDGDQKITYAKDATSEALIDNDISSFKNLFKSVSEKTRIIPYNDGLLVEDVINMQIISSGIMANKVKTKLTDNLNKFVTKFREELTK
jgi:hypothetical protein